MTYNTAEERWAAAAQLAEGVEDEHMTVRRRKSLILIAIIVGGAWLLGLIAGVVVALYSGGEGGNQHSRLREELPEWQLLVPLVLFVVGTIVGIIGFVWAVRSKHYIVRWKAVISPLNRSEMKAVRRQIAGKSAVDKEHLPTIIAIARQQRVATWGVVPLFVPFVFWFSAVLVGPNEAITLINKLLIVVAALAFLVGLIQIAVAYRRSGRFLEKYAHENPQPTTVN